MRAMRIVCMFVICEFPSSALPASADLWTSCGLTAIANLKKQSFECRACKNKTACSQLYIPYAAKLLFQELQSMNIAARLYTVSSGRIRD
jgi:DNA-directed RNA polymerase beta subunit